MLAALIFVGVARAQAPAIQAPRSQATGEYAPPLQSAPTRGPTYRVQQHASDTRLAVQPTSHTEQTPRAGDDEPLLLRESSNPQRLTRETSSRNNGRRATTTVLGSLCVVLAAFFVLVWLSRKTAPKGLSPLPGEVYESLGRAPLTARQQMQLIRLGNKLVLLSVSTTGVETLTEITDIDEVNRLAGMCQQDRSTSISATFRQVLAQYGDEPAPEGFIGDPSLSQSDLANRTARRERQRGGERG